SMDDAALGATTGQDGINIGLGISAVTIEKVLIHDNDGLLAAGAAGDMGFGGTSTAGAIVIKANGSGTTATNGIVITANTAALLPSHNLADIVIDTDAGSSTGNTAFLNVAAKVSGLNIAIGEIGVSESSAVPGVGATTIRRGNDATNYNKILSGLTLTTGQMTANVQLGAAPQGAMIKLDSTMTGGLTISNLGIYDSSTIGTAHYNAAGTTVTSTLAGEIRLDSIKLANAGGADLTVQADISVVGEAVLGDKTGYLQIKTMKTPTDAYVAGVHLGSATAGSIGDIEVQGMQVYNGGAPSAANAGAVIKISGH
ncbi:MAG TPA: pilus assembly protein FilA, partial [Acinetobacter sp.]|nr:pilus assembly protein FilA [Acinetobacter sp.]